MEKERLVMIRSGSLSVIYTGMQCLNSAFKIFRHPLLPFSEVYLVILV